MKILNADKSQTKLPISYQSIADSSFVFGFRGCSLHAASVPAPLSNLQNEMKWAHELNTNHTARR